MNQNTWSVVTGATSGIGRATTLMLLKSGRRVLALGRRKEKLQELFEAAENMRKGASDQLEIYTLDVRSRKDVEHFVSTQVTAQKSFDLLVNNAGLAKGVTPMQKADPEDWDQMLDTNVKGLLYMTRALLPEMLKLPSATIVNMGSVAGIWTYPLGGVYCASKAAVRSITEGLRMDLLGTGVRVCNIEPGMVETEFSEVRLGSAEKAREVYKGMKPLTAEDIAETISWVISRPTHVNIQEIVIFPTDQAAVGQVYRKG